MPKSGYYKGQVAKLSLGIDNDFETGAARWVRLYYTMPNLDGTGGTEVADAGYSAKQITVATEAGGTASNNAEIIFGDAASDSTDTVKGCAVWTAASGGNMIFLAHSLGAEIPSLADAATDIFTATSHGLAANAKVQVSQLGTVALPIAAGTYFAVNVAANTFQLAATSGGVPLNLNAGLAIVQQDFRKGFYGGDTLRLKVGSLSVTES